MATILRYEDGGYIYRPKCPKCGRYKEAIYALEVECKCKEVEGKDGEDE